MKDLETIAKAFAKSADASEACARKCGDWKRLAEVAAVRQCVAILRTPGVSDHDALCAITEASVVCLGD